MDGCAPINIAITNLFAHIGLVLVRSTYEAIVRVEIGRGDKAETRRGRGDMRI